MSGKRTKKDVEDAYRRGFKDGFNVRPNPLAMILRSIWRKHELKKLKRAYQEQVRKNLLQGSMSSQPIGVVKSFTEDEHGLHAEIELKGPKDV